LQAGRAGSLAARDRFLRRLLSVRIAATERYAPGKNELAHAVRKRRAGGRRLLHTGRFELSPWRRAMDCASGRRRELARCGFRAGGTADRPYDSYHQACDTLANVNVRVFSQMADAAAVALLLTT
jgi:hypothetical protein